MSTFAELGVSAPVCAALSKRGIREPFAIQSLVMTDALAGRDILAKSRTGSGKTLAFGVPLVERLDKADRYTGALILVPTRELAVQVATELTSIAAARQLRVVPVYGGTSVREQAKRGRNAHILVATPGRLQDLLEQRLISLRSTKILVLDEADRMLDMGFQPQVDRILEHVTAKRQTMFFSATLDGPVGKLARAYTHDAVLHEIESPKQTVEGAEHRFLPVTNTGKLESLTKVLAEENGPTLVFVRTKHGADRLVKRLGVRGHQAVAMHGNLSQGQRQRALHRFSSGRTNVLVATDVASRGIDVHNIAHVINFDPPEDDKAYVHRVGRTARAGRTGIGTTLVLPDQQADVGRLAASLKLQEDFGRHGMTAPTRRQQPPSRRRQPRTRTRTHRKR